MACMTFASIFFLTLIQFSWEKCCDGSYKPSYCDDEKRKLEYSNVKIEPYPINEVPFNVSLDWNFLETVPCSALFYLSAVKCGQDKNETDKEMPITMNIAYNKIRECMGSEATEFCNRENIYQPQPKSIPPGPMHICISLGKVLQPGCYDIYVELRARKDRLNDEILSCYQFKEMEFK
ncbi:uncharacterized protein [Centruroides vittatus]|uniref:uncharacterized protein n=1 Tax=Centruroides vittatus TaxID=120091 RepID=UPI00350FCA41